MAGGGGGAQGQAMALPLDHRQAVVIGSQATDKQGIAVEMQMVGSDRGRQVGAGGGHEVHRFGGGDVFEHHLESRMALQQGRQVPLQEDRLAIKDVHLGIGDLAMDQQGQAAALHGLQHPRQLADVTHACSRVGGGVGWIKLAGREHPLPLAPFQLSGINAVGQIGGHQRRETAGGGQGCQDPLPIGPGGRHRG